MPLPNSLETRHFWGTQPNTKLVQEVIKLQEQIAAEMQKTAFKMAVIMSNDAILQLSSAKVIKNAQV
jgi:hypothetical protein